MFEQNNPMIDQLYWSGFGSSSYDELIKLQKALQSNPGITDMANLQGGAAFAPQSLEKTLVRLSFAEEHIKLYKDLKSGAMKAMNTVEEYNINDGYGQGGGWVGEMENPEAADVGVRRKTALVKFIREMWRVSDVVEYTQQVTPAVAEQQNAAMMRLLRNLENTMFFGDSAIIPMQVDGLQKHIETNATPDHIFDLRGTDISEAVMKQAAELIFNNFGMAKKLYVSPSVQTKIDSLLTNANNQRFIQNAGNPTLNGVSLGYTADKMVTAFGTFTFEPDIFLSVETKGVPMKRHPSNQTLIEGATSAKAPATPTVTLTPVPATVTGSKWYGSGYSPSGTYGYRVSAVNQYGESKASVAVTATVATSGAMSIAIQEAESPYQTLGYDIYREAVPGSGIYHFMKRIAYADVVTTYVDKNDDLPGTGRAFLLDNTTTGDRRVLSLGELAPIYSKEYAPIAPYRWGALNYYVNLKVYAPLRLVMFKNILVGTYSGRSELLDL